MKNQKQVQKCGEYKTASGHIVRYWEANGYFMTLSESHDVTITWGADGLIGAAGETLNERIKNGFKIIGWDVTQHPGDV